MRGEALSLFGSILTERFREESDVDMPVEFEARHLPGLIELARQSTWRATFLATAIKEKCDIL